MTFVSVEFIAFFLITVLITYILPSKAQIIWLTLASMFFYLCWDWRYLLVLIAVAVASFLIGNIVETKEKITRKLVFGFFISFCVILLLGLKYSGLFKLHIFFPIGLSFYILQAISYVADIYLQKRKPERDFLGYLFYMCFFCKLLSGPIERAEKFIPQISGKRTFSSIDWGGCRYILWGYFKKLCIADMIAIYVDSAWDHMEIYKGIPLLIAVFLYAIQIYCDFSGYSDIAYGCAKILGFELTENFKFPYFAASVQEFWNRWHISLSQWFRDYIYIPLGGNRESLIKKIRNVFVTFLVSGLWHGFGWNYLVWGVFHGGAVAISTLKARTANKSPIIKTACQLLTFLTVSVLWIPFRAADLLQAADFFRRSISIADIGGIKSQIGNIIFSTTLLKTNAGIVAFCCYLLLASIILIGAEYYMYCRNVSVCAMFQKIPIKFRYMIYITLESLILFCFIFQNGGYEAAVRFIYVQY